MRTKLYFMLLVFIQIIFYRNDSFRVMQEFADEVENSDIKKRLIYALERSKPFRNFKYEVDYNEDVRQDWFKFKTAKYEEWVRRELRWSQTSDEEE